MCQPILKNTPVLKHPPQVENRGPSDIESAEVYILWPSLRGIDQPLLYLTGQPIVEGPGSCHYVSDVNIHNIKVSDVNALLRQWYPICAPDLFSGLQGATIPETEGLDPPSGCQWEAFFESFFKFLRMERGRSPCLFEGLEPLSWSPGAAGAAKFKAIVGEEEPGSQYRETE